MRTPSECSDMSELRLEIDRLDSALIALLAERKTYIDRAIELKTASNLPARIEARVDEVINHVCTEADARGIDPELARALWTTLIEWSIAREERVLGQSREEGNE